MCSLLARTVALAVLGAASLVSPGAFAESVLRHVPQADLKVLDPVTNTAFITMQFAFMVYDQLFSVDENYEPHPQMVESYAVSDDGKSYRLTLRPGLKFHDGSPVRGRCGGLDQALGDEGSGGRKNGRARNEARCGR
jgi:peptide/nickel transport system substrate-binding protein